VTVVIALPFCDDNMAALLSLFINKRGQKKEGLSLLQVESLSIWF